MFKLNFVLSLTIIMTLAATSAPSSVEAQGFGDYNAPQTGAATKQKDAALPQAAVTMTAQELAASAPSSAQTSQDAGSAGGYLGENVESAIAPPPENYKMTEEDQAKLDEFLKRWEELGRGVKRVSCDVHTREFDGVMQQNSKRPAAHTWGQFRFISPNKLSYHVKGEFVYSDANPKGEWKESQNEWKIVLDGKAFTQYDFKNKKVIVFPIADEEQDMDLTMDNGQFPLFFVARAEALKSRFYLRIVTPESKVKSEVWLEAFPRYARDAQQFQSIVVLLSLKDLQPTYMRKIGVNGKSKTDLTFENLTVNKGLWKIEGTAEPGWSKEVREEKFSILRQDTMEEAVASSQQAAPAKQVAQTAPSKADAKAPVARSAKNSEQVTRQARATSPARSNKGSKRY